MAEKTPKSIDQTGWSKRKIAAVTTALLVAGGAATEGARYGIQRIFGSEPKPTIFDTTDCPDGQKGIRVPALGVTAFDTRTNRTLPLPGGTDLCVIKDAETISAKGTTVKTRVVYVQQSEGANKNDILSIVLPNQNSKS